MRSLLTAILMLAVCASSASGQVGISPGFSEGEARDLLSLATHAKERPGDPQLPSYWRHLCAIGGNPGLLKGFVAISDSPNEPGNDVRFAVALASPSLRRPQDLWEGRSSELVSVNYTVRAPAEAKMSRAVRDILPTLLLDQIVDCFKAQPGYHAPFKIYVTGYGLAGAAASVVSLQLRTAYEHVKEYSFGAPPVGNRVFAQHHQRELGAGMAFRVVNRGDPFVPIPPSHQSPFSNSDDDYNHVETPYEVDGRAADRHSLDAYRRGLRNP